MKALIAIFAILQAMLTTAACAMQFSNETWRGHKVLKAEGAVVEGDANRFASIIETLVALPHGVPVVLLDSPGGLVDEAKEIARLLEQTQVHTVIPSYGSCASACASILFLAGTYRTVDYGGQIGQHSCSSGGAPDSVCNEEIAQAAIARGVPYGALMSSLAYVAPHEMAWMSREEADCWGITVYPFSNETGYERSDPCALKTIANEMGDSSATFPPAQTSWRIDFLDGGYRAFLRPTADHMRELELNLYCDENIPGTVFLSMDIAGTAAAVDAAVKSVAVSAQPVFSEHLPHRVRQVDSLYAQVEVQLPRDEIIPFLSQARSLTFLISTASGYEPIWAQTMLEDSRKALIFAANHCIESSG